MKAARLAPPPPPGFVLEDSAPPPSASSAAPPPPPGFELVSPPAGPRHFDFDGSNIPGYDPATGEVDRTPQIGKLGSAVLGLSDMGSFGLSDEINAGLSSAFGSGTYGENVARNRRVMDAAKEQNPLSYLGGQVAGGVGGAVGLAKAGGSLAANAAQSGKGWFTRLLAGAADGGLAAAAYGAGSGEGSWDRVNKGITAAPYGMVFGAAGEGLAMGVGAALRRTFQGASDAAPGANPAASVDDAGQFGIPLSRAQATRSVPQANIENQLRSNGAMTAFDRSQREAVQQSIGDVQARLAGNAPPIASPAAAYESVPAALRGQRDALKAASQGAYEASVKNPNVLVSGDAVSGIPDFIRKSLDADQILIDPMYHQGAARALNFVDEYIGRMPKPGGDIKGVQAQLRWVENLRAGLRKNFPPMGPDAPALKSISRAIDDWTDEVFDNGLVSASDDVLQELKTARAKWSEYKSVSDPRSKIGGRLNPQFEAQARLRAIMDKDLSAEEVGQHLFGASVVSPKTASFMTAQELARRLGRDSPEWAGIRQSFWLRATRAGDDALNPSQIAKNVDGMLNGNGKGVASTLYSPAELDMMRKYAAVMRSLTPAREGFNNSNTANRLMPQLARFGTAIVGALAGGGGMAAGLDPLASFGVGAMTTGALKGMQAASAAGRAATATRVPVPLLPSGMGGAGLRGISQTTTPEIVRQRQPLELTVRRGVRP